MTEYLAKLDSFYRNQGIHPLEFRCPFRSECASGVENFTEARSALIGKSYGTPIRLVVLSLDPGSGWPDPNVRTSQGYGSRHSRTKVDLLPKNRHWYRTLETVAALLSAIGPPLTIAEALENFSHVNAAKCSLNLPRNRQAPNHVFQNCRPYLEGELALLQPDVIITQGEKAARALAGTLKVTSLHSSAVELSGRPFYWIRLVHPTAWGGRFLAERTVWPDLFADCKRWLETSDRL